MVLMCSNEEIDNLPFAKPTGRPQKAESVVQIDGVLLVRLANGRFLTSARDFHKWAYPIGHETRFREPIVRALASIGFITKAEADEHMAEHRRARQRHEEAFAEEMLLMHAAKLGIKDAVAQAIEARSAETERLGPKGESAVGPADAPESHENLNQTNADQARGE